MTPVVLFLLLTPSVRMQGQVLLKETTKILAPDGRPGDFMGRGPTFNDDATLLFVGASLNDDSGNNAGIVHILQRAPGTTNWTSYRKLYPPKASLEFGFLVSLWQDTLMLGSWASPSDTSRGSVFVFQQNQGGSNYWGYAKEIAAPLGSGDRFGNAIELHKDTLVVGAEEDDQVAFNTGACYMFERNQGGSNVWGQVTKLVPHDGIGGDSFGHSLALDQDTLIISAARSDSAGTDSGVVYIYERDSTTPGNWQFLKKLLPSDVEAYDQFGWNVRLSGDTLAINAPRDDDVTTDAGAVYVFERNHGGINQWGLSKKILSDEASNGVNFGRGLSLNGDYLAIPARGGLFNNRRAGTVYLHHRNAGGDNQWDLVNTILPGDSPQSATAFGCCGIDLENHFMVIGRIADGELGFEAGAVHVYQVVHEEEIELNISGGHDAAQITWPSLPAFSTILEQSTNLTSPSWFHVTNATPASISNTEGLNFYRLRVGTKD